VFPQHGQAGRNSPPPTSGSSFGALRRDQIEFGLILIWALSRWAIGRNSRSTSRAAIDLAQDVFSDTAPFSTLMF